MTLNKSDLRCPRCAVGTADGEGNCSMCARVDGLLVNYMGKRIREYEQRIADLHARMEKQNEAMTALETLKKYLSS